MKGRRAAKRAAKTERPDYLDDDRALAADFHAHRKEPGFASKRPTKIESRPTGMQVVSFRLPTEELHELLGAAKATGESLSEFVRTALMIRLGRDGVISSAEAGFATPGATGSVAFFGLAGLARIAGHNSARGVGKPIFAVYPSEYAQPSER
jgi:hypothetical protein